MKYEIGGACNTREESVTNRYKIVIKKSERMVPDLGPDMRLFCKRW
jgi:hypothetical protein